MSEYNKLNDALRVEKRLYQNLVQINNKSDRFGSSHVSSQCCTSSYFFFFTFCSKNTLSPPSAQRKSRPSTLSSTRFRLSARSWRRSCPGPGTWPWCWKGWLKGSLTLEVGRGREQPPGLRGALSLMRCDFFCCCCLNTARLSHTGTLGVR